MLRRIMLIGLVGCAHVDAVPPPAAPAIDHAAHADVGLWFPGETMSYEVQLQGVLIGEAQLVLGEVSTSGGHRVVVAKSHLNSAGAAALVRKVVEDSTAVIDLELGRPLQIDTLVVNGDKQTTAAARFDGGSADIVYTRTDEEPQHLKVDFKAVGLFDMHSVTAQLRSWRARKGETKTLYTVGGRRLWRIDVKYIGEETIGSKIGNRRTVIYEATSYPVRGDLEVEADKPARTFRAWLTDDADRVPLKCTAQTELGAIVIDLVEYSRP